MRLTRQIIDPVVQDLLTMPNSLQDLALSLANNYMPSFDNLDGLSAEKATYYVLLLQEVGLANVPCLQMMMKHYLTFADVLD